MAIPASDAGPGFRIAYAVVFGIILIGGIVRFIQTVRRSAGRVIRLTLFTLVIILGVFQFICSIMYARSITIVHYTPLWISIEVYATYMSIIAYATQNSIIVLLLFLWIELFNSVENGVFVMQRDKARRYAIARNLCVLGIGWLTFLLLFVPLEIYQELSPFYLWFSYIPVGLFIFPILVLAIIRWRRVYIIIIDKEPSRNSHRFMDLTAATLIGLFSFTFSVIFTEASVGNVESDDVVYYLFLSLIPQAVLPTGVLYFFSPYRKKSSSFPETSSESHSKHNDVIEASTTEMSDNLRLSQSSSIKSESISTETP